MVSILVLVDVSLKGRSILTAYGGSVNVSILVLVDVSLKATSATATKNTSASFNPCFSGCIAKSFC